MDRLHGKGVRVSLRNVIPEFRRGGSNRVVDPLLRDWKVERAYRPALDGAGLPERVQGRLASAVGDLWAAQAEAVELLVGEREAMEARLRAGDEVLDEALARLDVAEADMARMRERLYFLDAGSAPLRA